MIKIYYLSSFCLFMEPTSNQIKMIDSISMILDTWRNTDDIESPIHINEIEEFLDADLSGYIDSRQIEYLINELNIILKRVRKNK